MSDARWTDMTAIAKMLRDRELAGVEAVLSRLNALRAEIATRETARDRRLADRALDAARLSGADVAWLALTEDRLRRSQVRMAELRIEHEAALAKARKAFGRADVIGRIAANAAARR